MTRPNSQRLELTWIGKENRPRLEPRILIEEPGRSYHAPHRVTDGDVFDNKLIFGDNLLALKALEAEYAGQVKCIYIDPPYNTGSAFTHYDDGLEHSIWLGMMRDRLEILRRLLREDGSIWVQIDDNEGHYLKVMMDEVFGRGNYLNTLTWQKRISPDSDSKFLSGTHDYVHVYGKNSLQCQMNRLARTEEQDARYKNPDDDPRGPWTSSDLTRREYREHDFYPITLPSGRAVLPAAGRSWSVPRSSFEAMVADNRIYFGPDGDSMPRRKRFLSEVREGVVPTTWWSGPEVGKNEDGKREIKTLFPDSPDLFGTPKPERLLQRIIHIATNPGDLVLDSFAGSGTTGAVAHKMGRRWIMIELGEHCHTHIVPRLRKVIDGTDQGGISKDVNWKGGGGFRYYRLAPSLLTQDKWGHWVISKDYNPTQLAEAVCKHAGFRFAPDPETFWKHGQSTETDFIYVTTQQLTRGALEVLSDEVGPDRTLMVFCAAFEGKENDFPNLTVKKIPASLLKKCEWGKDDYSLKVSSLPMAPQLEPEQMSFLEEPAEYGGQDPLSPRLQRAGDEDADLFDAVEDDDDPPPPKKAATKKSTKGRGGKK